MEDKLYKAWQSAGKYYDLPDYDTFKKDMKDEGKLHRFHESLGKYYDVPDYDTFKNDMWGTAAQQQPTGQTGAVPAGQTTSAGEMLAQAAPQEQPTVEPSASQTRAQVKPVAVQQSAPVYNYTYFDESAIDPDEGELRMSMKPANWAYSERVNKSRGSHTKDNSPILRMSLDGGKLDVDVEREALADLKGMSDDEIYKYTNDLYNLTWGELTNEQRRDAASRLAAAGYELHVRDLGLGHAGDVDRNTDEVQTNLQDPKYRKLYDQGQWADPVDALSRQYDRLFAEQATGGTMGQQQATKMANRVLRAADKDQMFTWALQEAERTGGDPYKIYENIYDRFHAAVKDKLGAYNTRGQAAGLLGDIDAMIAEKYRSAEEADRSRGFNIGQMLADAENGGTRIADRLMDDPEMWALQYAKRTIEGVNNLIAEADHNAASGNFGAWLESSFAGGVARGFGQSVFDVRTWDMGFGDVRDATALMTALDKSDKGQPLTKAEQAMLDAKAVELAANAYFKSQVGYGYEAGKVTGESLPFMLEMMINPASRTGGLAVNKLVRYALKRFPQRGAAAVERQAVRAAERRAVRMAERRGMSTFGEKAANRILESAGLLIETAGKKTAGGKAVRAAVKTAGNVAGSAVMAGTTGLPGVIADTENRMIGQLDYDADETGAFHVTGHGFGVPMIEAFKDALVARGIENVTEMSEFDVLSNWLGGLTRKALDKLHMSDVYKFFDDIKMSDVAKVVQDFEKNTHWQGTFGEYLEEVEGGILNAWLVGDQTLDQNPDTGVFNVDNNVKTFLGVSLLGGAFSTVQTVGYRTPKARMRKNIEDADKQASELWGGTWQQFKNSVDGADDEEMEVLLANIVVNGNYSVEQRRAAAQYIKSVVAYRGAMKGEEIRAVSGDSNPNDEQSYEQGYQAQGEEREGITDDLQQAEQRLIGMGFNMDSFEGWTSDKFERAIKGQDHGYSDEELSVIREYLRAKAASDGINQRVEDDIDTQVQQASDLVDKQTNQGTGMVHRAVLNNGQEVYVTGGQLVMTGDGTMIDTEASDQSLFVYNPATGKPEQYTPQDFQSVDDPISPEQLKSEAARDIRMSVEQQAQDDKNGVLPFQVGDTYEILVDGQPATVTVVEDMGDNVAVQRAGSPEAEIVPKQQIQAAASAMKQAKRNAQMPATLPTRSAGARDNAAAATTGRVNNAADGTPAAPAAQAPALPMDEKTGEPVWLQTTPEQGYSHLAQSGMTPEDIGTMIDDRIAQADAAIAKASKGGTIDERLAARKAKDYWENVKRLHDAAKTAAEQRPTGQTGTNGRGTAAAKGAGTTAPAGAVRVEASQAKTMPVGYVAVNIDGTRAEDRGQMGIRAEDEAYFLKTMSPRVMRLLDKVAKSLGWKIRLYNGVNANERGMFSNGTVWVNRRAMTSKLAQWILGHEMTHGMAKRTGHGETFKAYVKLANEYKRRQMGDKQYEKELQSLIKAYQKHLKSLDMDSLIVDRAYIEEEYACDVTGDLLMNNPEMIGKLFSGVDSPGKKKGIIDMIVDFLNYLKSKLPWRSEERQALDDLSKRLNNLYRDAKAQTGIAKATAREEGSQIEEDGAEGSLGSFSITGNAEGTGFTASETVLEIWRVPQEDGTYKEEEHWVKKPLLDSEGNVVFRIDDKEFSVNNPITVEDLKSNPDTALNYMLADALRAGTINEVKADQVRQQYADMLNLYLEKGAATEDGNGFENLEKKWLWVGETVFRTVASNSDEQYSYSIDITKVCKKNEAVIRAISALQVKTGYGVTPGQILDIYEETDAEGFQVPCPVCYVFSRYINNGKYATAIVNGMKKYGKHLPGQPEEWTVEQWVAAMNDAKDMADKMKTPLKHANEDVKLILQEIDTLCREITSGKLSEEEAESKRRHVRALDERYRAALDVISQEAIPRWIKSFVLEGSEQSGWRMREDAALPEDMEDFTLHALDIRMTASAMEKYPSLTRYRRAGGSAGGKEVTFASNNELGSIIMGLGIAKDSLDDYPNYYQLAAEAATEEERQALLKKASERFDKARLYAQRQTLRGGQRMWSWSDNIESLSSDVASNLMQLELLGGALQTYSKQLEGVKMVAAMNGYVNASLMGYGNGVQEVSLDDTIEVGPDKKRYLKNDIKNVSNKGRERIIANGYDPETRTGTPVYYNKADGKYYVLVFDDVVGIDPFGHNGKRGLFSLNEEYDRAGNILVGMNDIHVRAAMADPRVFFIIPWHASGMHNHILKQMFALLGANLDNSTDYTKMQEETNFLKRTKEGKFKNKVSKDMEDFWDSHSYEDEFACGTGHIENGNHQGGLSESQLHYRELRDAIFDGTIDDEGNEEWKRQVEADEFLSQVYRMVHKYVDDGKMTEKDKEFIYPYEYWQTTEIDENGNEVPARVEHADVNGRRYMEYCRRMGFKPKFSGKYDEDAGYSPEGDFTSDPGYWKVLIDRRMYDRRGNYQELTPIDSSGLDSSMYDPDQTKEEFNVTEVATNEGAENIADTVYRDETERTGTMPAPNLEMTMDEAVAKYNEVTALQASLIKAEREAIKAAEAAKVKMEKARAKEAADVDGRKAKSVARAKESALKAMEVARQKAREVEEIAGRFDTVRDGIAQNGTDGESRFSLSTADDARFREVMREGGSLRIIRTQNGYRPMVKDYDTGEWKSGAGSGGRWRIEGMPGEFSSRAAAINEWRERAAGNVVWSIGKGGRTIEVEGEGDMYQDMTGTDDTTQQRWAQQRAEKGRAMVDELAESLGVEVRYVDDMTDEERAELSERQRRAKGWYDTRTGEVYINLGNHNRLYDIMATAMHETVAHKGLRQLMGDRFDDFLDNVYNNVDKHIHNEIDRLAERNGGDVRAATEEYMAMLAERINPNSSNMANRDDMLAWERIKMWVLDMLREAGAKLTSLSDEDLRAILYESYHNMQREGAMGVAQSVAFRDQVERERAAQNAAIPRPAGAVAEDDGVRFSIRTKPAPKKTITVYKLMRLGDDGKLYPLYIDGAVPIELGQWYDADSPNMEMLVNLPAGVHLINPETGEATSLEDYNKQHGITKISKYPSAEAVNEATANGMRWVYIEPTKGGQRRFGGEARRYWNLGINGSGTVSTYSMRPGWHAGSLPTMRQIGKGPGRNLRDDRFVWVEGEISADVDYNEEAKGNPDKDIPTHIPVDGFYLKATNANAKASQADRVGWYISGAFKPNRIMSDSEARQKIDEWNADPKHKDLQVEYDFPRESGKVFNAETMQLEEARYSLVNEDMKRSVMQGQPLFSLGVEQERTLMGMHNITAEKLRSALKLGGLANPSMAVINTEVGGFTNFGEISLIPSSDLIASRTGGNAGTWGADAYSPRFPETHRRLGKGGDKKMRSWVKGLKMRKEMEYNTEEQFNDYYNGFNIRDNALVYPFLHEKGLSGEVDYYTHMNVDQRLEDDLREANGDQWALLKRFDEDEEYKKKLTDIFVGDELRKISKKEGETFQEYRDRRREWAKQIRDGLTGEDGYINRNLADDLLYAQARAYKENGKFSESRTRDNAEQYIRDHGLEEEYKQYFDDKMQELGAELQVYSGSDSQGRSKYKPVSLDQVSRMMKRQGRAGGEGGIFADSPGAIRAKLLTPMKTLDQIRAKKDRLVSHEAFEQFRERYQEELREYADVYARGSMGALADIITSGNMVATAKRYNIDLDADAVAELNKFKNRVRALPTEYFETKFERPVMLDEFKKAIVPDDLPLDLQGALQRAGLDVVEYKHGDNADRERVTLDAVKNDDNIRFSLVGEHGAGRLDTLDEGRRMQDKAVAEEMERAGKDAKTIKLATGWERGADNKWRYEIMDKGIKGEFPNNPDEWIDSTTCPLSSIIDNDELFNAYPELKTASVEIRFDMDPRIAGSAGENHIDLNAEHMVVKVLGTTLKRYWPKAKELEISWNHFKKYHDEIVNNGDIPQFDFIISASTKRTLVHEIQHLIQRMEGFARGSNSGNPNYRKTAGEVEARNVENRYGMSEEKRRGSLAEETEDVPRSEQIVRFSISPEEQERQIHSENFKRWFGDWENDPEHASKVVDEEGKPLVVYHGTDADFTIFDISKSGSNTGNTGFYGRGFYFSDKESTASAYGEGLIPVYLDIKNPFYADRVEELYADIIPLSDFGYPEGYTLADYQREIAEIAENRIEQYVTVDREKYYVGVRDKENEHIFNYLLKQIDESEVQDYLSGKKVADGLKQAAAERILEDRYLGIKQTGQFLLRDFPATTLEKVFKENGFDGIIGDGTNFWDIGAKEYVVFDPNQIKSATENNGDFSRENPDIRYSLSQRERDYTANVLKKLRKAGVNVQLATDEEAQRVLDTAEQVDAELMRGWHGSSADFDAFDHSHMGEGEGAQAYGWGTYITEVEGIARQYAGGKPSAATIIKLSNSRRAVQVLDTQVQGMKKLLIENTRNLENTNRWIDEAKKELADFIKRFGADSDEVSDWHRQRDEQMEFWQDDADSYKRGIKSIKQRLPKYEKRLQEAKDELNNLEEKFNESGGRFLYEVSIPENNGSNYLPYDQVLSEETSKRLVDAIKPLYEETRANREKYIEEIAAIREPAQQKFGDDWLKSLPAESQERFEELIELQTSAQKKEADLRSVLVYIDAGDELLRWQSKLEKALGKKETSEFLSGLGYVGVEYPAMFRSGGREDGAKNYVIFNEGDAKIVNKTEFLKTSDGTVYGWHDNDGIHLTAAGLNPNTPMHEYTHGLMAMLKEREPEKYQQIVEALKDSEVWQEVLNDELYSNIRDDVDAVASEVASRLSGRESERRANESMPARIKRAIQELWDAVAEWFGVKSPMTADSIARMTLRELERGTNPDGDGPGGGTNGGDGPRFSLSGDGTVEEYNKAVNMTGRTFNVGGREVKPGLTRYNFQEAFQDSILAVKKLQQVVERHFGIKLPTRENAWMYENRLSSINMHERKSFIDKVYEPMMKIADRIMKRGVKEKELNAYLICKHGLERNQVFAMRDANEEADEIARNGGTPDMQQLLDKYRQRDYSGLTGVTGIEGDIAVIEDEAQRIVDEFEQRHGQLCNELWDAIRKATQWSLRKSYQSGMMSAATFDHVRNMFQYYVPLRGWSETTAEDVYSYMMGEHGAFNGVLKKAEGRTSVADDPLATIGNMAESALMQGNKNLLKQHLLRMAQSHPTDVCQVRDVWLVEGPGGVWEPHWPNIPDDATPDEIDQILQDHEADMQQLEASGQAQRVKNNLDIPYRIDARHVPEHAVVAKVAGIDHVVYINGNPRAAQAINGMTGAPRGSKSGFARLIDFIFGDMKRFYSSVLTSLNINFSGANFVRDLPHAYAMTFIKQGPLKATEYIARSFQVIPWVFKNQLGKTGTSKMDRYFQEFLSSGAVTGYAHINDVDAWKANNKRRFARLSALGKAKVAVPRALGEVINAIGWFSETLELIPRFTAFLVERQAGKDIATATKAAKDITTNFNKKGSEVTPGVWGAVANTLRYMKMFFNPIVQGMYQFVDVASMGKENKWVGPRMVLATLHLPVLGAIVPYLNQFLLEALGGDDDDDYWLINEYTRRNNVCIFTGNGYVKIPIAPVFREMYGMGEVVATRHAGKADNEKTVIDLIDQLRTMGSVEGQSSYNEWSLARFLLPEHFAPLIDVMNNENFTGGPIYYDNNYKEYAPEYTKAKKSTWSPLVAASKWLNEMMGGDEDIAAGNSGKWMNPAVWQHLITNVGGGFAQLAGDVVSGITDITEGKEIDASNMPVLKRFYSNSSDERAQWARFGIYKDFEKDYTLAKEKYQALDKRGLSLTERADEMVKFAESHPRAAAIYAVWEGGIKGADIPARLEKLGKDDPAYWDLVKEAVGKAEKAMNSGYVRAWEQKRKDRPDSMSDKELDSRFDKSDNDSIRHIMADEISKRAGSQDYYGRDAQATWSDKSVAAWEAYQDKRTSDDIKADAELSNLLKVDDDEKDKARIKMLGYIKDELNKIRRGKDATSRSAGVKGLGEGDDERIMNELRAARAQLIEDLKSGSAEQAYRNLERRTMRLGLRKKEKEL